MIVGSVVFGPRNTSSIARQWYAEMWGYELELQLTNDEWWYIYIDGWIYGTATDLDRTIRMAITEYQMQHRSQRSDRWQRLVHALTASTTSTI